ncbi:type II toxin-antitoxin system VapC family toxin [Cupriavidus metallidurans]|uniref:PIN domain-containing protein n=1 Tax=Cupriavidus TaxID=106589 RepID=UPI000E92350B|nr:MULTISPECIES: type II toxin-antitoxin system VapC family toxin [unclassified Cupriavidus]GMG93408.1 PIN domain-containing protein [Cupriavidus sp. TKC]HBD32222.1 VapC toxin family PIN domain ribonuclease [Cupriavidus sp.]HBO82695.1 VapC toxin family PIN domain ribonuclease [Cupriavidus sp.]
MIGLDTCVLARLILDDDAVQSPIAAGLIASLTSQRPGYVSTAVILELAWVLQRRRSRPEIIRAIYRLLRSRALRVESAPVVYRALAMLASGNIGFADCLIDRAAHAEGCEYVATFDHAAGHMPGFRDIGRHPYPLSLH